MFSVFRNRTYEYFQSIIWQEGQKILRELQKIISFFFLEKIRVAKILNLDLTNDNYSGDKISNSEAKNIFFQTLALPLQSVCR